MFNMYLSGWCFNPAQTYTNSLLWYIFFKFCGLGLSWGGDASSPGPSIVQPFQSESPSALLSEIGNPFSWTRFLAPRGEDREDDKLQALDRDRTGTQSDFNQFCFIFHFFRLIFSDSDYLVCIWSYFQQRFMNTHLHREINVFITVGTDLSKFILEVIFPLPLAFV